MKKKDDIPENNFSENMIEEENDRKAKYPVLTLEKALDIINYFKEHTSEDGISLSEICQALDMKKSSVHRILNTLYEYNYVEKTLSGNKYKLSWELYYIGNTVPLKRSLSYGECVHIMTELCEKYTESINMSVLKDNTAVVLYSVEPNIVLKATNTIGDRQPLYCTAKGKLFLSEMPEKKIYDYYRETKIESFTPTTIITPGKMLNELYDIRECGFSMDREEHVDGLTCISMPIRNFENRIVATLSCSGPTHRINTKLEGDSQLKKDLAEACSKLSHHLGYKNWYYIPKDEIVLF